MSFEALKTMNMNEAGCVPDVLRCCRAGDRAVKAAHKG